jgi:hypothetical protein
MNRIVGYDSWILLYLYEYTILGHPDIYGFISEGIFAEVSTTSEKTVSNTTWPWE